MFANLLFVAFELQVDQLTFQLFGQPFSILSLQEVYDKFNEFEVRGHIQVVGIPKSVIRLNVYFPESPY